MISLGAYEHLLHRVRTNGDRIEQRAILKTGERPYCLSSLGESLRIELSMDSIPLIATKKVSWKNIAHELIWMLRGDTNIKYMVDNNCHIWDAWADENGELGPVYGKQWRNWDGSDDDYFVDQIERLEEDINDVKNDPHYHAARRLILSAWNPGDMPDPKVPTGCHTFAQFFVRKGRLSCHLYMRSCDLFLGLPYNMVAYAMLTQLLAIRRGLDVGVLDISFGDAHIYSNHLEQVDEQLTRHLGHFPGIGYNKERIRTMSDLDQLTIDDITVFDYNPMPALKGEVAV